MYSSEPATQQNCRELGAKKNRERLPLIFLSRATVKIARRKIHGTRDCQRTYSDTGNTKRREKWGGKGRAGGWWIGSLSPKGGGKKGQQNLKETRELEKALFGMPERNEGREEVLTTRKEGEKKNSPEREIRDRGAGRNEVEKVLGDLRTNRPMDSKTYRSNH